MLIPFQIELKESQEGYGYSLTMKVKCIKRFRIMKNRLFKIKRGKRPSYYDANVIDTPNLTL